MQLSVASATPSHSRPPCLGSGAVHSRPRCRSQSELQEDHSLHSPQPPSTEGSDRQTHSSGGTATDDKCVVVAAREAKGDMTSSTGDTMKLRMTVSKSEFKY